MRGRFITFEGGEGTGKSSQAALLAQRLRALGIDVVLTREPGGSPGAEIIRHILLSGAAKPLGADAEAILFAAARDDHIHNTIEPALTRGQWVVCDRFMDSTRIYQGELGGADPNLLRALERVVVDEMKPDLTVVLDVPVEIGLARAGERRGAAVQDRFESESKDFHERLREAFRTLAQNEPNRCVLIDASGTREAIADAIWTVVSERLDPATTPVVLEGVAS